jgi:flagellar protein FlaG
VRSTSEKPTGFQCRKIILARVLLKQHTRAACGRSRLRKRILNRPLPAVARPAGQVPRGLLRGTGIFHSLCSRGNKKRIKESGFKRAGLFTHNFPATKVFRIFADKWRKAKKRQARRGCRSTEGLMKIETQQNFENSQFNAARIQQEHSREQQRGIHKVVSPSKDPGGLTDAEKIEKTAASLQKYANSLDVKLEFRVDRDSEQIQVKVIDPEKDEVIRKIPPDEILKLAESIESMLGTIMNRNL